MQSMIVVLCWYVEKLVIPCLLVHASSRPHLVCKHVELPAVTPSQYFVHISHYNGPVALVLVVLNECHKIAGMVFP